MDFAGYWGWLTMGIALIVLEVITPGVFLLWIGLGALVTGLIAAIIPALSSEILGAIFAVLSVISVLIGRKLITPKQSVETPLNNRTNAYIGQTFQVFEAIVDGRGKVSVGDSQWLATSKAEIAANETVKVVNVKGTILEVEPVNAE